MLTLPDFIEIYAHCKPKMHDSLTLQDQKPVFSRLPDELLITIFELACLDPGRGNGECEPESLFYYEGIKALALVCYRFNHIVTPLLYRNIHFRHPQQVVPPTKAVVSLKASLQKNPSLGQHCQVLGVTIVEFTIEYEESAAQMKDFAIAGNLVSWLKRVRRLKISGMFGFEFNEHIWLFFRNIVPRMRELEHLSITGDNCDRFLRAILDCSDIPSLRRLDISDVLGPDDGTLLLEPKTPRTASFNTLSLLNFIGLPQAASQLLQWSRQISHFYFTRHGGKFHIMDVPMLNAMLLSHKDSLKVVHIGFGFLPCTSAHRLFNASDFPNLKVLRLSRRQMGDDLRFPSRDADLLLAPNLTTFEWDCNPYNRCEVTWTDFGDREEEWVREFARAAMRRKSTLKKIHILFNPDAYGTMEDGYPWDRMDKLRDYFRDFRPCRMALTYSEPPISKEEWLKQVGPRPTFQGRDIRDYFSRVPR